MATFTVDQSGDWNDPNTYIGNSGTPGAADDVVVDGEYVLTIPAGVTAQCLSLFTQGPNAFQRATVHIAGTLELYGEWTAEDYTTLSGEGGGELDLRGNIIEWQYISAGASQERHRVSLVGEYGNFFRFTDSVGGGFMGGIGGGWAPGTFTMNYVSCSNFSFNFGGNYGSSLDMDIFRCCFQDMAFHQLGAYFTGAANIRIAENNWQGHTAASSNFLTIRMSVNSPVTGDTIMYDNVIDMQGAGASQIRVNFPARGNINGLFVRDATFLFLNHSSYDSNLSNSLIDISSAVIGEMGGIESSLVIMRGDNPHTFFSFTARILNNLVDATFEAGSSDGGDHAIVTSSVDKTVDGNLFINARESVVMNALGGAQSGNYIADHNTIIQDIGGGNGLYGTLARNESGGTFTGTLTMRSNLCYVRSNPGAANVRAINIETAGNDQVTVMDNNAYVGFDADEADLYFQVTSATKSIGDPDYGESDITVDPNFVDDTRDTASWATLQNGGVTAIESAIAVNGYDDTTNTLIEANKSGFVLADVLDWIRDGYAPQAAAYDSAAHDGGTIGAVGFVGSPALVVNSVGQTLLIDQPALSLGASLVSDSMVQQSSLDESSLVQHHLLAVDDLSQLGSIDVVTLLQHFQLSADAVGQSQSVDESGIIQHQVLTANDLDHSMIIDPSGLLQQHSLEVDDMEQTVDLLEPVLTQAHVLTAANIGHAQLLESSALFIAGSLAVNEVSQAHGIDLSSLVQGHQLVIDGLGQDMQVEISSALARQSIAVNSLLQSHAVENITLDVDGFLAVQGLLSSQQIDSPQLTQHSILSVNDLTQDQLLEIVGAGGGVVGLVYGRLVLYTAEERGLIVTVAEDRKLIVH